MIGNTQKEDPQMSERQDPTPAALYARVSSDRQDVDLSVTAQLRALRDYAEKNGYVVAREYVDEAESGRIADRPQFRRMLDEASRPNSPFHEILVWKFSRFTRKREHAVAFKFMLLASLSPRRPVGAQPLVSSFCFHFRDTLNNPSTQPTSLCRYTTIRGLVQGFISTLLADFSTCYTRVISHQQDALVRPVTGRGVQHDSVL